MAGAGGTIERMTCDPSTRSASVGTTSSRSRSAMLRVRALRPSRHVRTVAPCLRRVEATAEPISPGLSSPTFTLRVSRAGSCGSRSADGQRGAALRRRERYREVGKQASDADELEHRPEADERADEAAHQGADDRADVESHVVDPRGDADVVSFPSKVGDGGRARHAEEAPGDARGEEERDEDPIRGDVRERDRREAEE